MAAGFVLGCSPGDAPPGGDVTGSSGGAETSGADATSSGSGTPTPGASSSTASTTGADSSGEDEASGDPPATTTGAVDCDEAVHDDLASGEWHEIVGSEHRQVCACDNGYPETCGASYCGGVFAYSGATMDTLRNRLIVWGGGHNDYYGNEVYAFDITDLQWSRLTEPSTPAPSSQCAESLADGTPSSRHTYDGLEYIPEADAMLAIGGSQACEQGAFSVTTWLFDFATLSWSLVEPTYEGFYDPVEQIFGYSGYEFATDYDPVTGRVFIETTYSFSSYDLATNTWTLHVDLYDAEGGRWDEKTGALDPVARKFVSIGNGNVFVYDLETYAYESISTDGAADVTGFGSPGLTYDPGHEAIVGWANGALHALDLEAGAWTQVGPAWSPAVVDQIYGRFAYVPCEDGYVMVPPDPDATVHLFKK